MLGYVVTIFYHWWYFNWGGTGPPEPPLATPMKGVIHFVYIKQKKMIGGVGVNGTIFEAFFLDRELKLQARNSKRVIFYLLKPFVLIADSAKLKLRTHHASSITIFWPISLPVFVRKKLST